MTFLRFLVAMRLHKSWAWLGVCVYACAVTFPHQAVQDVVEVIANHITRKSLYQYSAAIALIEAAALTFLFVRTLRGQESRRWLIAYWMISLALITATWGLFTANNTELVHYPQYFPEGVALLALTLSPAESLAWIVVFGGLDEAFQYTFLVQGRPLPYDFNDVYMDLTGGAAGVIFAMALLTCKRRTDVANILKRPGVVVLMGIVATGIGLWASGKMLLYEALESPSHWFSLSRLKTPTFWYFSPNILGPHHFHELSPIEGPILILATIAVYGVLDRTFEIS
ncbi:MAG: hypothetical protein ABSB35_07045 [Bryobacteraceae bacterium]